MGVKRDWLRGISEATEDVDSAIAREKQHEGWRREKTISLVEAANPTGKDLAADWFR